AMKVAPEGTAVALVGGGGARLIDRDGDTLLSIPASATPATLKVLMTRGGSRDRLGELAKASPPPEALKPLTGGGPPLGPEVVKTRATTGRDDGPFAVDVLTQPDLNPWSCQVRSTAFDFFADGRSAAVCTWDGDVWRVEGIGGPPGELSWRRIASG